MSGEGRGMAMRLDFRRIAENGATKALPRTTGAVRVYVVELVRTKEALKEVTNHGA